MELVPNWSVKIEYLYYDMETASSSLSNYQFGCNAAAGDNFLESYTSFSSRLN